MDKNKEIPVVGDMQKLLLKYWSNSTKHSGVVHSPDCIRALSERLVLMLSPAWCGLSANVVRDWS